MRIVAFFIPASSSCARSRVLLLNPSRSAHRRYIRNSISAQSCESSPFRSRMDGENSAAVVFLREQQQELLFFNGFAKGFGEGSKLILKFFVIGLPQVSRRESRAPDPVVHLVPLVKLPVDRAMSLVMV